MFTYVVIQVLKMDTSVKKYAGFGIRHFQSLLMFLCVTTCYATRGIMSLAIVGMTDETVSEFSDASIFDWDKKIQDTILSSFFWGYVLIQFPGGYVSNKYGPKIVLTITMFCSSILTCVTPLVADYTGWQGVCACRVLQGMALGTIGPCINDVQGKWSPANERGRLITYVWGGSDFGTIFALFVSGYVAASTYGWPYIFYATGILNTVVGVLWMIFGAESPADYSGISEAEKQYIQQSLHHEITTEKMRIPWIKIFTSLPVWATCVAQTGNCWLTLTFFTEIPSYLNEVMGVKISSNGVLSALPFVGTWFFSFVFSVLSDKLISKGCFSLTTARKLSNTLDACDCKLLAKCKSIKYLGIIIDQHMRWDYHLKELTGRTPMWGASFGLLALSFVPAGEVLLAVSILVFSVSIKSAIYVGHHVNQVDIAPNFAGTVIALGCCFSNAIGTIAPITVGHVLKDAKNPNEWKIVFLISSGIAFATNLFYISFGSAETASWNYDQNQTLKIENSKDTENRVSTIVITSENNNTTCNMTR